MEPNFTIEQATLILQRHLNISCIELTCNKNGSNNIVYFVNGSNGFDYVIRLCGSYWKKWKTEREVATMLYIHKNLKLDIPVPIIYGFCSNVQKSGIGAEHILMSNLQGVCLQTIWPKNEVNNNKQILIIVEQVAKIIEQMQSCLFNEIGSFHLPKEISNTCGIGIIPEEILFEDLLIGYYYDELIEGGPFVSYIEYTKCALKTTVNNLKKCKFLESSHDLIPKIEQFVDHELPMLFIKADIFEKPPKICIVHGDFDPGNIIIDPITMKITGIIDWEWSGAFPAVEEWFASFQNFGARYNETWIFNEEPTIIVESKLPCNNDDEDDEEYDYDPTSKDMSILRETFFTALQKVNVTTPDKITHFLLYAKLWYLRLNICPWWLIRSDDELQKLNVIPKKWYKDKENARKHVESILNKFISMKF